jgi:muramoyltetrapeptide carboxypeptidase
MKIFKPKGEFMLLEPVRQGDIVDIVAPASRCSSLELKSAVRLLKEMGLRPRVPSPIFAKSLLFANTDQRRLEQLRKAIYATDSSLVWCVRGGYGALRLMPDIVNWPKPKRAKIFLGFSDITTLHAHFNQKWGWPTLHGPLLDRFGREAMSPGEHRQLFGMLFGEVAVTEFFKLQPMNAQARRSGSVRGPVVGGNLAVLQSSLGTPSALRGGRHILFFEDTGERPHRVDRMLSQLAQAGALKSVRAVVFGYFHLSDPKDRRGLWNDVLPRFAASLKIPVLRGLPVGHDPDKQYTLPFNTPAVLSLGRAPHLLVKSGIAPA